MAKRFNFMQHSLHIPCRSSENSLSEHLMHQASYRHEMQLRDFEFVRNEKVYDTHDPNFSVYRKVKSTFGHIADKLGW